MTSQLGSIHLTITRPLTSIYNILQPTHFQHATSLPVRQSHTEVPAKFQLVVEVTLPSPTRRLGYEAITFNWESRSESQIGSCPLSLSPVGRPCLLSPRWGPLMINVLSILSY
jgi:hypothetical protein